VEVDKVTVEKGKYQHPDLFGKSPELGMDYASQRQDPHSRQESPHARD
jgi:hypothetical protein